MTALPGSDLSATAASLVGPADVEPAAPGTRIVAALTAFELRLAATRGESLLVTFAIPLTVLAFFSAVDVLPRSAGRPVDALLPGAIAIAVIASGLVALSIATAYERSYGVLKRLAGTPATAAHRIAAKVIALLVVEVAQTLLLVGLAVLAFGWLPGPGANGLLVLAALALGTATFAALGVLLAGTLRAETTLAVANALFLVALLVGDVVVPLERLPSALAAIGAGLPFAALVDVLRAGLGGVARDGQLSAAILGAWATVAALGAVRLTRWD